MDPAYRYRAVCERVIDGDTFLLRIDLGFRASISIEGRLRGVDTPEIVGESRAQGLAAKEYVEGLLASQRLLVQSYRDQRSFTRWIVDVWLVDGRSVADMLVEAGMASRGVA